MLKQLSKIRYIKFIIVGAIGTIPNYIMYIFLRQFEFRILFIILNIGWLVGIIAGATSNYILNELWTWGGK